MNFDLTSEQQLLQESLQRVLTDSYTFEQRKTYLDQSRGWAPHIWQQYAELGLLGLPFSLADGGFGGGAVEIMLTMEALGSVLALEPFLASVILAGTCIKHGANDRQRARWLPPLIEGTTTYAFAHIERGARYALPHVSTQAERQDDHWCLSGRKDFVIHGDSAQKLVVSARSAGSVADARGITLFMVDAGAVQRRSYRVQDGTRAADIVLNHVLVSDEDRIGNVGEGMAIIDAVVDIGIAALVAEAVGVMRRAQALTVDYLKIRKQFGVVIGSFQALQHRAVDLLVLIEQAQSLSMYASMMSESADPALRRQAVSAAKYFIGQAGRTVGEQAVQLHGGIGVTEECAVGHYYRRLTMIDLLFGDGVHHLAQVAARGGLPDL